MTRNSPLSLALVHVGVSSDSHINDLFSVV